MTRKSNEDVSDTMPTAAQVEPPSVEYSQLPLPLVKAVIAIPSTELASTSVTRSPPALKRIEATVLPVLDVWFSVSVERLMLPVLSSTGASLTAVTLMLMVLGLPSKRLPESATLKAKVAYPTPFASPTEVKINLPALMSASVII